jgi:hypothetical protein
VATAQGSRHWNAGSVTLTRYSCAVIAPSLWVVLPWRIWARLVERSILSTARIGKRRNTSDAGPGDQLLDLVLTLAAPGAIERRVLARRHSPFPFWRYRFWVHNNRRARVVSPKFWALRPVNAFRGSIRAMSPTLTRFARMLIGAAVMQDSPAP